MSNLFLASSFKEAAILFESLHKNELYGQTVLFISTASTPEEINFYVDAAKKVFKNFQMNIEELDISSMDYKSVKNALLKNKFIYISGGNTFYLLQELKKTKIDCLIKERILKGHYYIGESAGAIICAPDIEYIKNMDDINKAPDLHDLSAFNVIDFFPLPHFGNYPFESITEKIYEKFNKTLNLFPFSNNQTIFVTGSEASLLTVDNKNNAMHYA